MEVIETKIKDLLIIKPKVFADARGYFFESYNADVFKQNSITANFVQDNQSLSSTGVLRGLHFQAPPFDQGKLVRVIAGAVLDVAVDIRKNSPTYGKHQIVELSEENGLQFWIPEGFAHGYVSLEESIFLYKCTNFYAPGYDGTIKWDDADLGVYKDLKSMVNFNIEDAIVSDKDKVGQSFVEFETKF